MAISDEITAKGFAVELGKSSESFTRKYDTLHISFVLVNHFHDVCDFGDISVGMVEDYDGLVVARDFNGLRIAEGNQSKSHRSVSRHRLPEEDRVFRSLLGFTDGRVSRGRFHHALSVERCERDD